MKHKETTYYIASGNEGNTPRITCSPDGWRANMTVFIPNAVASVLTQARVDFLGYSEVRTFARTRYIHRELPHCLPFWDVLAGPAKDLPALWCTTFEANDGLTLAGNEFRGVNGLPKYRWAKCILGYNTYRFAVRIDKDPLMLGTGRYAALPDEARLNRFVVNDPKPGVRAVTLPQGMWTWVNELGEHATGPAAFGVPMIEPLLQLRYKWVDVPEVPIEAIKKIMGCTNSVPFDGHAAGSLLCSAPEFSPQTDSRGATTWTITYDFAQNEKRARTNTAGGEAGVTPRGINWFLKLIKKGTEKYVDYRRLTANGLATGTPPFRAEDFNDLFRLSQSP